MGKLEKWNVALSWPPVNVRPSSSPRRLMHIDAYHWTGAEGFGENRQPY
jgi:hypothetical protein